MASSSSSVDRGVNPYALLGVSEDVTDLRTVTEAFRSMVLLVHPDKGGSSSDLHVVTCAYAFIKRQIASMDAATADFEAFCRDWRGDLRPDDDAAGPSSAARVFDNAAFEAETALPIYVGPGGPEWGEAIGLAAGQGGELGYAVAGPSSTSGVVYVDYADILRSMEREAQAPSDSIIEPIDPCMDLVAVAAGSDADGFRGVRGSTGIRGVQGLVKRNGLVHAGLMDYAEAFAPIDEEMREAADAPDGAWRDTVAAFRAVVDERIADDAAPPFFSQEPVNDGVVSVHPDHPCD
jgi:hypothetical protein